MIVLDTNVVSALMATHPDAAVVAWAGQFPAEDTFMTGITAAELASGVARLPEGRRKRELSAQLDGLLTDDFDQRVLPFDLDSAPIYARVVTGRQRAGAPIGIADAQVAAICRWAAPLATRNVEGFTDTGIIIINPWDNTDA